MNKPDHQYHHLFKQNRCLLIGEVAQAHDGSLGSAHAFIDAIARAGADAVKFQTHIAAAESTPAEPWRVKFGQQDASRYEYWKRMEFSEEQWAGLKQHADDLGLLFLSSPFSIEAFHLLSRIGVAAWKVASGEVSNDQLIDHMLASKLPVLLSTGMSPVNEIDRMVEKIKQAGSSFAVLQCTSMYPTPAEKVGLNMLSFFRERYQCPVGLSDHSGKIYPGLAAASLGAQVLEVHVTLSREAFGPDVPASLTPAELAQLVEGVRFIKESLSHPVDKGQLAENLQPLRELFTKSIVASRPLHRGTILTEEMLALKKPGTGLPAERLPALIGRCLKVDLQKDAQVKENDLE